MEKNPLILFILFSLYFLFFPVILKGNNNELLQQANDAYMAKKYDDAVVLYEQIVNNGNEGALLYYNIGNAYFKNGNIGKSILWYERALRLSPNNKDIQHNLAFVNQKIVDKIDVLPTLLVVQWWNSFARLFSVRGWAIASIIASFLFILFIILFLIGRQRWIRSSALLLIAVSFLLLSLSLFFAYKSKIQMNKHPEAIIMSTVVYAKSTPDRTSGDLFAIHEGLKVYITDKINEWVEIQIPNGEKGWIQTSTIEII